MAFLAAEGVAIDQLSSRITSFNIMDHVRVPAFPAYLVRVAVLSLYELAETPDAFTERLRLLDPMGETIVKSETIISLPQRSPGQLPNSHRSIHMLWAITLNGAGDYRFVLDRLVARENTPEAWEPLSSLCLTVIQQAHPILNAPAPAGTPPPAR